VAIRHKKSYAASGRQNSYADPKGQIDITYWPKGLERYLLLAHRSSNRFKPLGQSAVKEFYNHVTVVEANFPCKVK